MLLVLPTIPPLMLISEFPGNFTLRMVIFLSLVWIVLLLISMSALTAIFKAVLYVFAHDGTLPSEFSQEGLRYSQR